MIVGAFVLLHYAATRRLVVTSPTPSGIELSGYGLHSCGVSMDTWVQVGSSSAPDMLIAASIQAIA